MGRFKLTESDKELIENYKKIIKTLKLVTNKSIIFSNEIIYIILNEIGDFIETIENFNNMIHDIHSIQGLKSRHDNFISKQRVLLIHLNEMNEHPTELPKFMEKHI
jgi:archaellum component FlaC